MTRTTGNILFLGDLAEEVRHLEASLLRGGQNVFSANAEDSVQAMDEYSPDLVVTGLGTLSDEAGNLLGRGDRREPLDHVALLVDEELLEVPGDVGAVALAWLGVLQDLVEGSGAVAVDLDLGEHREVDVVLRLHELEDLLRGSGLLLAELVARETEDREALVVVVERTQTCVLGRETSIAGDVDDQADLAAVGLEGDVVTGDR
jgi:hypothetical protein